MTGDGPPPARPGGLLARVLGGAAAVALVLLVAALAANIVGRTLFGASLVWAPSFATWCFLAIVFLGMPLQVLAAAPARAQPAGPAGRACAVAASAVAAFAFAALAFAGPRAMAAVGGTDPALGVPSGLRFAPMAPLAALAAVLVVTGGGVGARHAPDRRLAGLGVLLGAGAAAVLALAPTAAEALLAGRLPVPAVLGGGFGLALVLAVPVPVALLFAVAVAIPAGALMPLPALAQTMANGATSPLILAVPLFVAAAGLMVAAGIAGRMVRVAARLAGRGRAAVARVNVLASLMMAGLTGSSYADAAAGARLLVPAMRARGYGAGYATAVTAAAALMPNLVPPSVALLLLAAAADLSVARLWLAGILPGLVVALALLGAVTLLARLPGRGEGPAAPAAPARDREGSGVFGDILVTLAFAAGLVGGVRLGVLTVTEAGVAAIALSVLFGVLLYRTLRARTLARALSDAAGEAARIGFLIAAAAPFSFVLLTEGVPQDAVALAARIGDPVLLLLALNVMLLAFGMILDIGAALLVLGPLAIALAGPLGMDPVHLAVVVTLNLLIGGLTPPVGMIALVAAEAAGVAPRRVFLAILPLLLALLLALAVVALVPALTLWPAMT